MNGFLMAAGCLSAFTCGVHLFAGGPRVARPLLAAQDIEPVAKYTNYYCWHLVSIVLAVMSAGFVVAAFRDEARDLALMMTALAGAFTAWSIGLILWSRRKPFELPQWSLFLPIAVLGVIGLFQK